MKLGAVYTFVAVVLCVSPLPFSSFADRHNSYARIRHVFSDAEVEACGRFRTPEMVKNTDTGAIHVIARCCGANMCSGKDEQSADGRNLGQRRRLDNNKDCKVIMKSTFDNGQTWGNYQVLSPKNMLSYANGNGIYDRIRQKIIAQYAFIPGGSTTPAKNVSYFQIVSHDDGKSWSSPRDITRQLEGCNPDRNNMQLPSAGTKLQTPSGRLLFPAHGHANSGVCLWWSDDGGNTYNVSKHLIDGNEVSVALANSKTGELIMNGRPRNTGNYRTNYFSQDDGETWSGPTKSTIKNDDGKGCERSLLNIDDVLFSAEPEGRKRTKMVVRCSRDEGQTWASSNVVNGDKPGAYSDMVSMDNHTLFMVWEDNASGNFFSAPIGLDWCK